MSFYGNNIKPYLPKFFVNFLAKTKKRFREYSRSKWLINSTATKIFGRQYSRSLNLMEIDLTYDCNLSCKHCNRSCPQAPSKETITIEQIKKMLEESVNNNIVWKRMRLLGGEPTMHPDIINIVKELYKYKKTYSPNLKIVLVTNGVSIDGQNIACQLKKDYNVEIEDSSKNPARHIDFIAFNQAPLDDDKFKRADYTNGCSVLKDCGVGFTPYGFYPCAIAGGIDRVIGLDKGYKKIPNKDDKMLDQLSIFCPWCGHFKMNYGSSMNQDKSISWIKKYDEYSKNKIKLTRY